MRLRVLSSGRFSERWAQRFDEAHDFSHLEWDDSQPVADEAELASRIAGYQVLITEEDEVTREVISRSHDLAVVIDTRAAPVNVDVEAATDHGVVVINTPGRNADAVGDLTVMMMVMISRNVWPGMTSVRDGKWLERGLLPSYLANQGFELREKTIGLIGLGATGQATARRLAGFGVDLVAYDPFVSASIAAEVAVELVEFDELLRTSDIVSLHVPLLPATTGLIGARELALLKPSAFLINAARARLIDTNALVETLRAGRIGGAALDVFTQEPLPLDDPLLQLPNVVAVPHLGGATHEVADHQSRIAWQSLEVFLDGGAINVVNPEAIPAARARLEAASRT
jgi:phosphoglycerate dehydrogenase-like enzyme